jgi:alpha-L-fucosidase
MKYFVITAKHHDGFGMVDFPETDYDIVGRTPYAADPMIPLSQAMRAAGLRFGFYFSQSQDWSKPGGRPDWFKGMEGDWNQYVEQHAVPQLHHLLGGTYGKIDILWFDSGSMTKTREGGLKIWEELAAQPQILVNNRLNIDNLGDFSCPEQWVPTKVQTNKLWETCMTLNGSWGYNPTDPHWKSTDELIRNLCYVVSRGGNYLLNVGPKADGSWEPQVAERLKGIGAWMRVNGESIYGTHASTLPVVRWGSNTWKPTADGCRLYCQIMEWPKDTFLHIPLKNKIRKASFLGDPNICPSLEEGKDGAIVRLNRSGPIHSAASVLVLDLDGERPEPLPLVVRQEYDGSVKMWATEAECEDGVFIQSRESRLDGWVKKKPSFKPSARWNIRMEQGGRKYRLVARCGFNAKNDPQNMAFIATIDGKELKIPVTVTGVELDQHNKESRQLVLKDFQSLETIVLPAGFQTLELRAEGVLENFEVPKGRANKKLCYSAFPMLEELRLEPVK